MDNEDRNMIIEYLKELLWNSEQRDAVQEAELIGLIVRLEEDT
jgi:hypothetical protein